MTNEDQSYSLPGGDEAREAHGGSAGREPAVAASVASDTENPLSVGAGESDGGKSKRNSEALDGVVRSVLHAVHGTGGAAFYEMAAQVLDILIEETRAAEQMGVYGASHALWHLKEAKNEVGIAHSEWETYVRVNL